MILLRWLKKKVREVLVFFKNFCKRDNHNAEKYWHKGKPQCNFCKSLSTLKRVIGTRNVTKQIFVKNWRKKGKKTFSLLLYLMLQQKAMNGMLIVVVVIT